MTVTPRHMALAAEVVTDYGSDADLTARIAQALADAEARPAPPADGRSLAEVVYTAWTGQPYWGGCDQRENVERVLDALGAAVTS